MPWTTKDVDKHKKGLNPKQKRQWVATANSALKRCKAGKDKPKGGGGCEGYAIKVASAAVSGASKRDWSLDERSRLVRLEFSAEFNTEGQPWMWPEWIFEDYLIVTTRGRKYKVGYTFSGGDVEFASRDEWVEVEHEWVEVPTNRAVLTPIRAVDGEPGRYRGYAVMFNTTEDRDMYGTYFDDNTRYMLDLYDKWPWLYHHMKNQNFGHRSVGVWDKRGIDDVGVFIEGEITTHGKYRKAVERLIGEEVLFTSSQAIHSGVRIAKDGHVDDWPICEVSSTVTPGDWRMENPISSVASRAIDVLESDGNGGSIMSWKDELKTFIDGLGGSERAAGEAGEAEEQEQAAGEQASDETEARTVDATEVAKAVVEMLDFKPVVDAVRAIDEVLKEYEQRLGELEQMVKGLAQSDPERMKSMLSGEKWYENLFVASRDAPAAEEKDVEDAKQKNNAAPMDSSAVFGQICASAGGQK